MIAVKIQSGLGNQLFQYAFAYALAQKYETELHIDSTFARYYPSNPGSPNTMYHLSRFQIEASRHFENNILRLSHRVLPKRLLKKLIFKSTQGKINRLKLTIIRDDLTLGQEAFQPLHNNIYLDGYFQYPELFTHLRQDYKSSFAIKRPSDLDNAISQIHQVENPVAVNLRRRDYLRPENVNRHGLCSVQYYKQAIRKIKDLTSNPTFFVISDDISDSKLFLQQIKEDFRFINDNPAKDILSDFYLMQQCNHLIIANSSYSWWAAYLHPAHHKIIIAPREWVSNKDWNEFNKTIIPDTWVRI